MAGFVKHILRFLAIAIIVPGIAFGVQAQNPRGGNVTARTSGRGNTTNTTDANTALRRSATSVIARSTSANNRRAKTVVMARPATVSRSASKISARSGTKVVSGSANVSRAATSKTNLVRSAKKTPTKKNNKSGLSRAGKSRVTAIFDDVSKIGNGYSDCRDAYTTCMDQFCAMTGDAFGRCICNDKYMEFRDKNENLMEAYGLIQDFTYNNLNAVDKTAAEVNAMYSATAGEEAVKKDSTGAQQVLDEANKLLSGTKNKKRTSPTLSTSSLGILDFDNAFKLGDVWNDTDSLSSSFDWRGADSFVGLEGNALYQKASKQCAAITRQSCSGDAMFDLAVSSYSILITQSCNDYEQRILASNTEKLQKGIRELEGELRQARLDEYLSHNSKDVNECLELVEEAMTDAGACGSEYERCLDYSGQFLRETDGKPAFTYNMFQMTEKIAPELPLNGDIISANPNWNTFLERKKVHAESALDQCRDISDKVWPEYKRTALIRIAQAQSDVIEKFKDDCVEVIKECYNENDSTLKEIPTSSGLSDKYSVGAIGALAVRGMCYQDVLICASLYGGSDGCDYDSKTRKIVSKNNGNQCGLNALLAYVDTVDTSRVAQECEKALMAYARDLCTPDDTTSSYDESDDMAYATSTYPAKCATMPKSQLRANLLQEANKACAIDLMKEDRSNVNYAETSPLSVDVVEHVIRDVFSKLGLAWTQGCEEFNGVWFDDVTDLGQELSEEYMNKDFYNKYYGGSSMLAIKNSVMAGDQGVCLNVSEELLCKQWGARIPETGETKTSSGRAAVVARAGKTNIGRMVINHEQSSIRGSENKRGDNENILTQKGTAIIAAVNAGKLALLDTNGKCSLTPLWYEQQCKDVLGGTYTDGACLVGSFANDSDGDSSGSSDGNSSGSGGGWGRFYGDVNLGNSWLLQKDVEEASSKQSGKWSSPIAGKGGLVLETELPVDKKLGNGGLDTVINKSYSELSKDIRQQVQTHLGNKL